MNKNGLIVSSIVVVVTVFFVVAYSLFNVFGVTQSRVKRNELTFVTGSSEKTYDGLEMSNDEWYIESGALAEGDVLHTVMNTSITNPAIVDNEIGVTIFDSEGKDVTINYQINYELGTLIIHGLELTIRTESASKDFDGDPLSRFEWDIESGQLLATDHIEYVMASSITTPGVTDNQIGITIYNEQGQIVNHIYDISYNLGSLTVRARDLIISTISDEKGYDGLPLLGGEVTLVGEVADINSILYGPEVSITNPGSVLNEVDVRILDREGNIVTSYYNITYNYGTLTVHPVELVISSYDDSKIYDGTPLSNSGWQIENGSVAPSHHLVVNVNNEITDVGSIENTIYVQILDDSGNDVTHVYDVELVPGTLTVIAKDLTIATGTDSRSFDGTPLTSEDWSIVIGQLSPDHRIEYAMTSTITYPGEVDNEITINILNSNNEVVTDEYDIEYILGTLTVTERSILVTTLDYDKSYDGEPLLGGEGVSVSGDLAPNHTIEYGPEQSITYPGTVENSITLSVIDEDGNDVTAGYDISYDFGELVVHPMTLVIKSDDDSKVFDGEALSNDQWELISGLLLDGHSLVVDLSESITFPGTIDNEISAYIFNESGTDVTDIYDIEYLIGELTITPREITITTITDEKTYDGFALLGGEAVLLGGLADFHEITYGVEASITYPGIIENSVSLVILDINGSDVSEGYEITYDFGTLTVNERNITVFTDTFEKTYDGLPLGGGEATLIGELADNHTIEYGPENSITNPGSVDNEITARILDGLGNDVTDAYNITYDYGTLTINPVTIILKSFDDEKVYDGEPLYNDLWELLNGTLLDGHRLVVDVSEQITEPGTIENTITAYILDTFDNNVTDMYDVEYLPGDLTVTPREITITTTTLEKNYDGEPLLGGGASVLGTLASGHYIEYGPENSITDPGEIDNELTVVIKNALGNDVTDGYDITYDFGTLTINPIEITLSSYDATKFYDGLPLFDDTWNMISGALLPGHELVVNLNNQITNPGAIANTMSVTVLDALGNDVTDSYDITHITGTLIVNERDLIVSTITDEKDYDGIALDGGLASVIGDLAPGHYIEYGSSNSITNPGTIENDIAIVIKDASGNDVGIGYNITYNYGTLTINPISLIIRSLDDSKTFDGTALTNDTWNLLSGTLLPGHSLVVDVSNSITNPGTVENTIYAFVIEGADIDVTDMYDIEFITGDLTVYPRNITVSTNTDSKDYDATPLLGGTATLFGVLADTHYIEYSPENSITNPGSLTNAIGAVVKDGLGNDVSIGYNITYDYGTLTINPISIVLRSFGDSKVYDGLALSDNTWELLSGSLLFGHSLNVDVSSSITNPGTIENVIIAFVEDGSGNDVSDMYDIEYITGDLTVSPREVTVSTSTDSKTYDGLALDGGLGSLTLGSLVGTHYIDYGAELSITNPGTIDNNISFVIRDENGFDVTVGYDITYDYGTLTVEPITIVLKSFDDSKIYDGLALTNDTWELLSGSLLTGHNLVVDLSSSITNPGTIENAITAYIFDEFDNDVSDMYDINYLTGELTVSPISITISTITDGKTFDGEALLGGTGSVTSGSLLGTHYIEYGAEITLIYPDSVSNNIGVVIRDGLGNDVTIGYDITYDYGTLTVNPKDITISTITDSKTYDGLALLGGMGTVTSGGLVPSHYIDYGTEISITNPGSVSNDLALVIRDSVGNDVSAGYNITLDYGTLTIEPITIVLKSFDDSKTYDGTALTNDTWQLLSGSLLTGHNLVVDLSSSITNPGTIENTITAYIIDGSDNDVSSMYDIQFILGELTVTPINITIETLTDFKDYDAYALYGGSGYLTSGSLIGTHYLEYGPEESITYPGSIENNPSVVVRDALGNDVSIGYNITYNYGTLTINPIEITVSTATYEKTYDGLALEGGLGTLSEGSLIGTHYLEYGPVSSLITPGSITNAISIVVRDSLGNDVTDGYDITTLFGTLTVNQLDLTVTTATDSKDYDSTALLGGTGYITSGSLIGGHYIDYGTELSITSPGTIDNDLSFVVRDGNGDDVTFAYNLTYDYGTLTINPINITITTGTDSKDYDSTALLGGTGTLTSGSLIVGDYIEYGSEASITYPGTVDNSIGVIIRDSLGNDVTIAYNITYNYGTLTINPINITVATISDSKDYDGLELLGGIGSITSGSLYGTHYVEYGSEISITDPGTVGNDIGVIIRDDLGNDVTAAYNISYDYGTLTINTLNLTISTGSDSKVYDGLELLGGTGSITSGSLFGTHYIEYGTEIGITDPGSIENDRSYVIRDSGGNDVTGLYTVTEDYGTLTITPIDITISTNSDTKVYDETALLGGSGSVTNGSLFGTHYIEYGTELSITEPGAIENTLSYVIRDSGGNDVTGLYNVTTDYGTLQVNQITLVFSTSSANKVYDGTPLVDNTWTLLSGAVLAGHNLNVIMDNSITDVGSIPNTMFAYILDDLSSDVSGYYNIIYNTGTLEILTGVYSSSSLATSGFDIDPVDAFSIYSTVNGTIYFRDVSFGDYDGSGWSEGIAQDTAITDNPFSIPGETLEENGYLSTLVQVDYIREQVAFLSPYFTTDAFVGTDDIHTSGDTSVISNINVILYDYDYTDGFTISDPSLAAQELIYRNYVYNNYLDVRPSTLSSMQDIAMENGLSASSPTIISDVQTYIQNAATYEQYFATIPEGEDVAVYFLTVTKEGICQHYAAAATLMYRTLGVPARYVTGYLGTATANSWSTVQTDKGHAWVEVYIDGLGWVPVEVTGTSGEEVVDPIEITVTPNDVIEIYETGKTIVPTALTIQGYTNFYVDGYTYEVTYNGSLSAVGTEVSSIATFLIRDSEGNNVTNEFDISYAEGLLQMYSYEIELVTSNDSKTYDGTALTNSTWIINGTLDANHHVETVNFTGSQLDVGASENTAEIVIFDDLGNDVTSLYSVTTNFGNLIVSPLQITITSDTASKTFDGTPLTADGYTVTGTLATTDTVVIDIIGSQIGMGTSNNTIESIVILNGTTDVTSNYIIEVVEGTLSVTPY